MLNDIPKVNNEDAVLAIEVQFIYDNWKTLDDFLEEFNKYKNNKDKREYFIKRYGKKYKDKYGEYPKLVLKSVL